jgi:hypothetical protein
VHGAERGDRLVEQPLDLALVSDIGLYNDARG